MAAVTRLATRVSFVTSLARRYQFSEFNSHAPPHNSSPFGVVPTRGEDQKNRHVRWVFLGCPGVGKGTYASRLSSLLGVPHIATGDLVREELASSGPLSTKVFFFFFFLLSIFILFYF
jgi:adenylate kinase